MSSITKLFVSRPTLVFVLLALISLAGSIAAATLVRQQFPNVSQPTVGISVSYSGASTTVMRDAIVKPIEDQLAGTPDLQTLSSTIQGGSASISATFLITSNQNTDLVNVQKAIQSAGRNLPTDLISPSIRINDPSEATVVTLALTSVKMTAAELSLVTNGRIVPAMQQVPDVSNVTPGGIVTPAYEVTVDPRKLSANNLTLNDVLNTVSTGNVRAPGGIAFGSNRETSIDIRGDIVDPDSVLQLPISAPASANSTSATNPSGVNNLSGAVNPWTSAASILRVGDVANVSAGYEPRRQYASINGEPGIFLQIQKTSGSSEVDASDNVLAALPRIRSQFPDVHFAVLNVQSRFTQQQIEGVLRTLMEGIILTGIVMLFFLGSWRNAIVVLIAIPASLGVALFVMKIMGLTLDTISLLGMTLVVGILVDDSTVVLENIERHHELGQEPHAAAIAGRTEIGVAAIVITLVDVVVFLPIAFIQGQVGRQLSEFGIVVVISTLTSLFVSFTITPSLAGNWALRGHWKPWGIITAFARHFERLRTWYAHTVLPWGLKHRIPFILGCVLSFGLAISLVPAGVIGEEFIPPIDRGELFIQVQYPVGTPLTTTAKGILKLEKVVDKNPDLSADTASSGGYSANFGGFVSQGNVGQLHLWLNDDRKHSTDYWVQQYKQIAAKTLPGATSFVVPATGAGGGNAQPIDELVTDVSGGDPTQAAAQVFKTMQETPGASNVNSSAAQLQPQVELLFDRTKARALNVSIETASAAARAAFGGSIATQFETDRKS